MKSEKNKILIIEDEVHIAEALKINLTLKNFEVKIGKNGVEGIEIWELWRPSLIVLDLMMPKLDGIEVIKRVRRLDEKVPIIILSAKDSSVDKVQCLEMGVDDYLSKPFNLDEFLLRVERLLKRSNWAVDSLDEKISFGNSIVNLITGEAKGPHEEVMLTDQEIKLLKVFFKNKNVPISRQKLLEDAWGYEGVVSSRTVDNFLVRFRKYFENDPKKPKHFMSVRSVGYVFKDDRC